MKSRITSLPHFVILVILLTVLATLTVSGAAFAAGQFRGGRSRTATPNVPQADAAAAAPLANCRYGAATLSQDQFHAVDVLGAGWYLSFWPIKPPPSVAPANGAQFAHVIRSYQEKSQSGQYLGGYYLEPALDSTLAQHIASNPGELWIIGNEVERGPDPGKFESKQGDMFPDVYAQAYHDGYHFVKQHDPTARVAISAMVQVTPGRLQYLDLVWQAYQAHYGQPIPVDVWNTHLYVLPEVKIENGQKVPNNIASVALGTDPELGIASGGGKEENCPDPEVYCIAEHDDIKAFAEQIIAMRRWLKERGQQAKPLILSEYSLLWPYQLLPDGSCDRADEFGNCFTPERVSQFMLNSFNLMEELKDPELGYALDEDRLVQAWLWYAVNADSEGSASGLLESDLQTLTQPGRTFQQHVQAQPALRNLVVAEIAPQLFTVEPGQTVDVSLTAVVGNNGNHTIFEPFAVTAYADAERTQVLASATVAPPLPGCATKAFEFSFVWRNLGPGIHPFWVVADGDGVADENGPLGDNVVSSFVAASTEALFLPVVERP